LLAAAFPGPLTFCPKEESGTSVPPILHELRTNKTPPTFQRTNKFTEGFQTIMDSYGIASYQEVNPGLFAVVTFPFLFAVMFGDIGHGTIILFAAIWMIINQRKWARADLGEIVGLFFLYVVFYFFPVMALLTREWKWAIYHPPYGFILHLYRVHLQRYIFQDTPLVSFGMDVP
jgi:vacuolar-type H+-ATPase subunit I/STV1